MLKMSRDSGGSYRNGNLYTDKMTNNSKRIKKIQNNVIENKYCSLKSVNSLCYPEELGVIVCVWKLLQLRVSPRQFINLLLQSLQWVLQLDSLLVFSRSLIICVISEHLFSMDWMSSVKILSLSSTAVCAERCRTHIIISSYCCSQSAVGLKISLNNQLKKSLKPASSSSKRTFWDSTASFSSQSFISLSWICCLNFPCVSSNCFCWTKQSKIHKYIISETKGNKRFFEWIQPLCFHVRKLDGLHS